MQVTGRAVLMGAVLGCQPVVQGVTGRLVGDRDASLQTLAPDMHL